MIHLHDWYVACLVHFYPELVVKVLKNTNNERFDRSKLFAVSGVRHGRGVQGAVGPDGGAVESDEAGGQHLQEDRQPHPERHDRNIDVITR